VKPRAGTFHLPRLLGMSCVGTKVAVRHTGRIGRGVGDCFETSMRAVLMVFGSVAAISASWCTPLAAQTEAPYEGPSSIGFEAHGALAPTQSASVNLTTGAADVAGPCPPMRRCGPSDHRRLTLGQSDLAKLRSLAIEVRANGLFDTACIERQRREADLADLHQKEEAEKKQAEWERQHPGDKARAPNFISIAPPPLDPFYASLSVEGVGTVVQTPEFGNRKSDARCVTPATQTLDIMVTGLAAR